MYEGGASKANIEAITAKLYEFVQPSFTGEVVRADQVALFLWSKAYIRELWQSNEEFGTLFWIKAGGEKEKKKNPVIKRMWRIIR